MKEYWNYFFLDNEKDMIVNLFRDGERLFYELETPNHHSGNLIRNFAKICRLPLSVNRDGLFVIRGEIPCYINGDNEEVYILRFADIKMANITPDGRIERKAVVPAIAKTLMSQTKDYQLPAEKTIFKTYIRRELKFQSDLHTHMNGNLAPDTLIALGIMHQIRYPMRYIRKLHLVLSDEQGERLRLAGLKTEEAIRQQEGRHPLPQKVLQRRIEDNTFLNFADLILNNPENAEKNIVKIRASLVVLKDGQAVFTDLEKVYVYRYVFAKGVTYTGIDGQDGRIPLHDIEKIPDKDVRESLLQMLQDHENPAYAGNTLFQDKLLWIGRLYRQQGIRYVEISDTTLVKKHESLTMLRQVHDILPKVLQETGVMIRFLAAMRRIPLTVVKGQENYLAQNLAVLHAVAKDPYVAGCDFVGEEINDIRELAPVFKEIVRIAGENPGFVIRVHAGENSSLRGNVEQSIKCVKEALAPGQAMPQMRIGHGLYTCSLSSPEGKELLKTIRENHVVLEFQLTSNVRLNNLVSLEAHPLHRYLRAGIHCVQGTDGGALYGTTPMHEQRSLERLLDLTYEEQQFMRDSERVIIEASEENFGQKTLEFRSKVGERDFAAVLLEEMEQANARIGQETTLAKTPEADTAMGLEDQIEELPEDRVPVIIAGGSFNTQGRITRMTKNGQHCIQKLADALDPKQVFFVLGHTLQGYERYLLECNELRRTQGKEPFAVYCFAPARLGQQQLQRLEKAEVRVRVSPMGESMGLYKSFHYEIFKRRSSVVVAFDGNAAAENLIQEAKNGRGTAGILVWENATPLREKAVSLEGYVDFFGDDLAEKVQELLAHPPRHSYRRWEVEKP